MFRHSFLQLTFIVQDGNVGERQSIMSRQAVAGDGPLALQSAQAWPPAA
jgi:hypothetical protein